MTKIDIPKVAISYEQALDVERFKEMDLYGVQHFALPIELMMENAGLQLATLIATQSALQNTIYIGVGNGNNGGGGLVAARRLRAWGYRFVHVEPFTPISAELPARQLERARHFGVKEGRPAHIDVWVDAWLGFSQQLPLSEELLAIIDEANASDALRISLDLPTGYLGDLTLPRFDCDLIATMQASKKILYALPEAVRIFLVDLGIPLQIFERFDAVPPPFAGRPLLELDRRQGSSEGMTERDIEAQRIAP